MRIWFAGGAIALALIALLVAALHFGSHRGQQIADDQHDPSWVAATIKEGFEGDRVVGDWTLSCGPAKESPQGPHVRGHPSRKSKNPNPKEAPPAGWKIPRCRVYRELANSGLDGNLRVTFRQVGLKRVLSLFLRISPTEVGVGDKVTVRLDSRILAMSVRSCERGVCLVIEPITKADAASLMGTKSMILAFVARSSGKQIVAAMPVRGLAAAVAAMCRIDR